MISAHVAAYHIHIIELKCSITLDLVAKSTSLLYELIFPLMVWRFLESFVLLASFFLNFFIAYFIFVNIFKMCLKRAVFMKSATPLKTL